MSLPSGYTRLEYIESDDSSYLDTGVTMEKTDSVTLEEVLSPFGTSDTRYTGANGYMQIAITSSGYSINGTAKKVLGTKDKLKCVYTPTTESLYINGALVESIDWSSYYRAAVKIGLFKMGDAGNAWYSSKAHSGKCYGASIIKNGVKVREFIPCKNASGVAGMWDDVSKSFFSSASSFAFIAGSVYIVTHKTLVNGTVYEVKGGKCRVNGTSYDIKKGRTLIDGTGYDITFAPPLMLVKGDLITMNLDGTSRLYRVLSVNGNVCKVLGMWDDFKSKYNETSTTTNFHGTTAQKYEGSTLDTYLNTTWYNTLSSEAKNAIVPENVVQYCYKYYDAPNTPNTPTYTYQYQYNWDNSDYENADNIGNVVVGNRNVFALDLKDIFDYIGKVCITSDELMTMFWNSTTKVSNYLWLRSSSAESSNTVWSENGNYGILSSNSFRSDRRVVRPALNLDMSKIQYTIV